MTEQPHGAPQFRGPTFRDLANSLSRAARDIAATPITDLLFAGIFVAAGIVMAAITYVTGHTFWLILAVLGFPLLGSLAAVGFYEVSRIRAIGGDTSFRPVARRAWSERGGQLPWLAAIIVVIFLFWFFLGHMIFALFLGLSPMTNISSSLSVFLTSQGLGMIGVGSIVGAIFAMLVFALSVLGMPMIIDREIDFMTAMLTSIQQVLAHPLVYLSWGAMIGLITLFAMIPAFVGLFIAMPLLGHASWHLYRAVTDQPQL